MFYTKHLFYCLCFYKMWNLKLRMTIFEMSGSTFQLQITNILKIYLMISGIMDRSQNRIEQVTFSKQHKNMYDKNIIVYQILVLLPLWKIKIFITLRAKNRLIVDWYSILFSHHFYFWDVSRLKQLICICGITSQKQNIG